MNRSKFENLTAWLFTITTIAAIFWISVSYMMGVYALKVLDSTELLIELSREAMVTILGVNLMKVVMNLFEHNNGGIFGTSIPVVKDTIKEDDADERTRVGMTHSDRKEDDADGFEPDNDPDC